MKFKRKITWILVFVLVGIEQFIKIVINNNYLHERFPILPPFLYFEPVFNRHYSWFNSIFKLGIGKWAHILIVLIMIMFIYLFYKYISKKFEVTNIINVMFAFLLSGAICSFIDKVFWNGSLDYILVEGLFTFDLKDVYINVFIGLFILAALLGNKTFKEIDEEDVLGGFMKYIFRRA